MELLRTLEQKVAPGRAVIVTVDVQNDFCHSDGFLGRLGAPMGLIQEMVPRLARFLEAARERGVPVMHVISHHDEEYASPVVTEQKLRHGLPMEQDGRPLRDAPYCLKGTWGAELYGIRALPGEEIVVIGKEPWRFKKRAQSFSRRLDAKYIVDPTERPRIPNRLARGRGRAT